MARLTRAESQARTRGLLVETARTLFLRDGYSATSLETVAEEAGFSKGAVYSNFGGKDELCLAVLDAIRADQAQRIGEAIKGARTMDGALETFDAWAETGIGDPAWTALEVEFTTLARRDPRLREELAVRDRAIRTLLAGLIQAATTEFGLKIPVSADQAATALLSLGIGLGLQRAIDPTIPVHVLSDTIRATVGIPIPPR